MLEQIQNQPDYTSLEQIPPIYQDAVIAAEDRRFYKHNGLDYISIARAIMKNAPIIILDEATANVDPENEKELVEAIDALTKEKTILMIAHRLKTVRNADKILVVDKGKIVEQGKHEELMSQNGIYRRFVNAREIAGSWKLLA